MKSFIKKIVCALCILSASMSLFAAGKNIMYVSSENLAVKATASMSSKTIATLPYGLAVETGTEKGKWVQISIDSKQLGWVLQTSLSKRKLTSKNITVNVKEIALAGKGANAGIEAAIDEAYTEYFDLVDKVEAGAVSEEKVLQFIKEGQLNGGEE